MGESPGLGVEAVHGLWRAQKLWQRRGREEFFERNQAAVRSQGRTVFDDGPTDDHPVVGLATVECAVKVSQTLVQPHRQPRRSTVDEKVRVFVEDDPITELAILIRREHDVVDVG